MADKPRKISALDRLIAQATGDGRSLGREDDPAKEKLPNVWDWLTRVYIGVDRVRQPATITIQLGPEGALVSITDRDLSVSCGAACPYLMDVLEALEAALASPNPPVRSWGRKEPRLRKRGGG